jgi:hypothetical protein
MDGAEEVQGFPLSFRSGRLSSRVFENTGFHKGQGPIGMKN